MGLLNPGPLAGLRILSLAPLYPGPFATMMLADLGADVVLIENPAGGDRTRRFPGHFEALNRNKRSVALDLKYPAAREAFLKLVETADAVVEGFRPGVMARLGLAPETLRACKAELVCASISSYGQDGPMSAHGGHDLSLQAAAGLIHIPAGKEAEAVLPQLAISDIASANAAALGIVCALLQRERTGHAATVDVSMLDSVVAWMAPFMVPAMNGMQGARLPPTDPAYGIFASSDGLQFTLSISGEDHLWDALVDLLGLNELKGLAEATRIAQRIDVQPRLRAALAARTMVWLEERFVHHGVPFGPVTAIADVPCDPQVVARGMIVDFADSCGGKPTRYVRQALVFDGQRTGVRSRAPQLGEHTSELLRSVGLDDIAIAAVSRPAA